MVRSSKRWFIKSASALLAGVAITGSALAQSFPTKPVTLMVPYPAGGLADAIARAVNTSLAKQLGITDCP